MIPKIETIDIDGIGLATPQPRPQFTVVYGGAKTGKTTTASYSESPVILPVGNESGQEIMIKHGIPCFDNTKGFKELDFVFACIARLMRTEHSRKTLIIDNLSRFRELVDEDVETDHKGEDITGFGRAQALSFPYYKRLVSGIKMLMQKKQMHVILIAHDVQYNVNLKDGSYFSRTGILAPAGENTNVRSLLESTAHNVLYIRNEATIKKDVKGAMGQKKNIALEAPMRRTIYTQSKGSFFAGTYNQMEDQYDIESSETLEALYRAKTNESLKEFWQKLYE